MNVCASRHKDSLPAGIATEQSHPVESYRNEIPHSLAVTFSQSIPNPRLLQPVYSVDGIPPEIK